MKNALPVSRAEDFAEWYQQVVKAADLAENSVVRGCMNILPWGFGIWEAIQERFDRELKKAGHRNAYFPLLIPLRFLQKEAQHVEGFAKECAVVTHHRLAVIDGALQPDPAARLDEPLVVRPTSETIIGDAFSRWVQSYKDLPIRVNQWCNVMRWELRPRLFLRTSEFLWQEGHTAHATRAEALDEARSALELYRKFAQDDLCLPVVVGEKTAGERFPGAVHTWAIEAMMQDGKALQAGTSHFLGQNFARAHGIRFESGKGVEHAWTTSWGISTRLVGAIIMAHSDDHGLVLPPAVAPAHVRILLVADEAAEAKALRTYADEVLLPARAAEMFGQPLRVEHVVAGKRPGDAFWTAVKQGVPIVVQIGRKELEQQHLTFAERTDPRLARQACAASEFPDLLGQRLRAMQRDLLARARERRDRHSTFAAGRGEVIAAFEGEQPAGFVYCPFDLGSESSDEVRALLARLKASIRCIPEQAPHRLEPDARRALSGGAANAVVLLARSY